VRGRERVRHERFEPGAALDLLALWGPAAAIVALHVLFATTYGIFRDELYYLSCARRLAWGYVDHPPLVALLTRAWTELFGDGLRVLRLLPALAVGGAAALTGSTARALGGGRFAVALAALATGLSPIWLSLGSILSMNAFDLLFWAALFRLLVALLAGGDPRLWLAFGGIAGLGLLNKISILFLGFGIAVGVVVARRWDVLRERFFWMGGAVAALLFAPHLLWQQIHGWPTLEFMENARRLKNIDFAAADFVREQLLLTGPVNALVWIAGLAALLVQGSLKRIRAIGFAYLAILAVMLTTAAKPYYMAAAYAALWAAGAVAFERATLGWRARPAFRAAFLFLLVGPRAAGAPDPAGRALRPLRRGARPGAGQRRAPRARPAAAVLRRHAGVAGDGGSGRPRRRPAPPGRACGGLRLRPELRRSGDGRAVRRGSPPSSGHLGAQQLVPVGPGRLRDGGGLDRPRRRPGAPRGAVLRGRRGRPLRLPRLHAVRRRSADLDRARTEDPDRRPLAPDQELQLTAPVDFLRA
jgi:hypothetical protein